MQKDPSNTPTVDDLKVIKQFLPSLKQKMGGKSTKKRKVAGMISPQVCAICGKAYDDYKHKSVNCPPCDKNLKECCAFVTMDGRYSFMPPKDIWKAVFQVGETISIPADDMDALEKKEIPESWKIKFAEVLKDGTSGQKELVYYPIAEKDIASMAYGYGHESDPNVLALPVSLYWVIKLTPSGLTFSSQTGGFACLHPIAKGLLFTTTNQKELEQTLGRVEDYIYEKYRGHCVPKGHFFIQPDEPREDWANPSAAWPTVEDADAIDLIFQADGFGSLKVDRSKLELSMEAWIYGTMDGNPCVFVTCNSD